MRRLIATSPSAPRCRSWSFFGLGADGDGGGYEVRAIFDNVTGLVPGEDVRVAGAKVGVVESLDVAERKKAAVVLKIDDARFTPFRADAKCTVRALAVIAEKFVECDPGTTSSPELAEIKDGDGKGQRLLPIERTSSPVDTDLVNNIMRRPFRERFSILHRRVRHRPGRPRRGAERGHPPGQSGAARDRPGAGHPRQAEPGAGRPRA